MSLFDNLSQGVMGQLGGGKKGGLVGAVAQLLSSGNVGGLHGLAQLFNQRGKGDKMASWVSTGENQPIAPEEVADVFGHDRLRDVASAAGVSEQEAAQGLSSVLPEMVDNLTPEGNLPDDNTANGTLSQLASRFLKH
jgi:uncharacterized protein YidB (DUF937 family)